ncbi:sugar ABC transporter ATP-binding protein [Nitrospirillum sp. BR 11828]|uniref:sugar ABC transporter ATP-binding protein n=1 Tax=Nitrospirillum sp. BR 11828 TaxID=3104325 RepID=UPI002AC9F7A7|nr:sugar ABC transporter ATP-binding protein [Nitrospirillum sp. BR 11828]MDZ5649552.1 sugar ABC transporter ATP-binding protein [Nitrospirillum sp. BR 11828]
MASPETPVVLAARGLTRLYPGVRALDGVDLTLRAGEIHALLGENGAGKSTLINLLTGAQPRNGGTIAVDGVEIDPDGPGGAVQAGIAAVYQEITLLPNLSVAQNLYLGREPTRWGLVHRARMNREGAALLRRFGLTIDASRPLSDFSTAVQQLIAIARAVDLSAKVLILDEPTASLDTAEVQTLFTLLRTLRDQGLAIVFVTHFLDQVYALTDRITVLRNGRLVGERLTAELPRLELVAMMLGKAPTAESHLGRRPAKTAANGTPLVRAQGLGRRRLVGAFDAELHAGAVLGAAGLLGSGRTETALLLFGAEAADQGQLVVDGKAVTLRSPRDAIRLGFGFCPEDRKLDGIVAGLSIRENIVLALQAKRGWWRRLSTAQQHELADRYIKLLDIRTPDAEKPIQLLSGGNQQKALLARWLATDPRLLILDEPTRGIDVGAHAEIVRLLEDLRDRGMALYVISSEIEEVAAYSDRVLVMRDRAPAGLLEGDAITPAAIVNAIAADHHTRGAA